jgi:phage-related protein
MTDGDIEVGSVSVDVVPSARTFAKRLSAQITPQAEKLGQQIGRQIADKISDSIRRGIGEGFAGTGAESKRQGSGSGKSFGGAFAREAQARIQAALRSLPEAQIGVATGSAEQKLKDLRAQIATLADKTVGIDISDADALAEIAEVQAALEALGAESPNIQVKVDTAAAIAELAGVKALADSVGGGGGLPAAGGSLGKAGGSIGALGPALAVAAVALPVIATALLALPSLLAAIVVPLGAIALGFSGIKKAAAGLAAPFKGLQTVVSAVFEKTLTPIFAKLAKIFPTLAIGFALVATALSGLVSGVVDKLTSSGGLEAIGEIFSNIAEALSSLAPAMGPLTDSFLILLTRGSAAFAEMAPRLAEIIIWFNKALTYISENGLLTKAFWYLAKGIEALVIIIGTLLLVGAAVTALFGKLTQALLGAGVAIVSTGRTIASAITSAFITVGSKAQAIVTTIAGIPGKLRNLANKFASAGEYLIKNFVNGLSNAGSFISNIAGHITDAVKGAINAAIDKINATLRINIDWPGPGSFKWNSNIGHLAKGTDNWRGGPTWVGEEGPEILNLPKGSQVTPNHEVGSVLGGAANNFYITAPPGIDEPQLANVLAARVLWKMTS